MKCTDPIGPKDFGISILIILSCYGFYSFVSDSSAKTTAAMAPAAQEQPVSAAGEPAVGAALKVKDRLVGVQNRAHLQIKYLVYHLDEDLANGQAFHLNAGERVRVLKNGVVLTGYKDDADQLVPVLWNFSLVKSLDRPLLPKVWVTSEKLTD